MRSDFYEAAVGELLLEPLRNGLTRPRSVRGEGTPMINMGELFKHRRIGGIEMERVLLNERNPERDLLKPNDLLFARQSIVAEGAGQVSIFLGAGEPVTFESHLIRARIDETKADPEWLFYFFESPQGHALMRSIVTQVAAAGIRGSDLVRLLVRCPPLEEQSRVAALLRGLEDKIDSNRRLAAHTEALATTLFEARFVRFADADKSTESQIGPIPKGWTAQRFSEAVEINPKVRIPKGEDRPFIEMAAVAPWAVRPSGLPSRAADGGCRFEPGDTLMARITGCIENGKGAFVDFLDQGGTGSTEFFVLRARSPLTPETVFLYSRSERLRAHAIANMTGTSGRQRVVRACFEDFMIAVPPDADTCRDATDMFAASFRTSLALWRESRTLASTRDALLPKLISGEIRVPDTADPEEVIGPAVEGTATV